MEYICSYKIQDRRIYEGKQYIKDMPTLYKTIVDPNCQRIDIEEDFAEDNFTPPFGLSQFIEDVNRINPSVVVTAPESLIKTYEEDIELMESFDDPEDLLLFMLKDTDKFMKLTKVLCKQYNEKHIDSLTANNKLASMHLELIDTKTKLEENSIKLKKTEENLYEERHRLDTLIARIRYAHEIDIDKEFMNGITLEHSNYSKILYIKEITRVHYVDTLIHYLQEICRTLYNIPARLVVIESIDSYSTAYQYPNCAPHLSLTKKDIAYGDIFMAGFQQSIMRDVLFNTGRVPYLIILDRTKWKEPFVKGDKVETIHTVSDLSDLNFEADADRVISYDEQTHVIPFIEDFENLSIKEKIVKYSTMSLTKFLVELLEGDE